jgi:hypothetical protein
VEVEVEVGQLLNRGGAADTSSMRTREGHRAAAMAWFFLSTHPLFLYDTRVFGERRKCVRRREREDGGEEI